jgi:DinB superfamily
MRKALLITCAAVCLGPAAFGQALTQADRDRGVKYLEQTRDGVIAATKDLSEAQWKFKAAPDKWSVAETLEHITLGEDYMFGYVTDTVMKAPAGAPDRDVAKMDAMVLQL